MTRPEWLMALSFLAQCEADAAVERKDGDDVDYFMTLSGEASSMVEGDKDAAEERMWAWLESRDCPPVPRTHADIGL